MKLVTCREYTEFAVYQTKKIANYKVPPVFKEHMSYEAWKKELAIFVIECLLNVYQTKKIANYKVPPVFKEHMSYEAWKKELAIFVIEC